MFSNEPSNTEASSKGSSSKPNRMTVDGESRCIFDREQSLLPNRDEDSSDEINSPVEATEALGMCQGYHSHLARTGDAKGIERPDMEIRPLLEADIVGAVACACQLQRMGRR